MSFHSVLYSTLEARLKDWLIDEGGEVTNLPLDLLNRAQDFLWNYRAWEYLVTTAELSLDSDNSASLPSDWGRTIMVYHDSNGDGKPDFYYYNRAQHDNGYYIRDSFAKATGHSKSITFYQAPSNTPVIEYQKILDDFVGSGTEYSYFPGNLLLKTAQMIHLEDSDLVGDSYKIIESAHEKLLRDYEQSHQFVNVDMRFEVLDDSGVIVEQNDYNMAGYSDNASYHGFGNSYDMG